MTSQTIFYMLDTQSSTLATRIHVQELHYRKPARAARGGGGCNSKQGVTARQYGTLCCLHNIVPSCLRWQSNLLLMERFRTRIVVTLHTWGGLLRSLNALENNYSLWASKICEYYLEYDHAVIHMYIIIGIVSCDHNLVICPIYFLY